MNKKSQIKLVAVDMDGTLLNHKGKVSKENITMLKALRANGKDFVICTGRNYKDAKKAMEEAKLPCDLICMNGAMTCHFEGQIIDSHSVAEDKLEHLMNLLHNSKVVVDIMTEYGSFTTTPRKDFVKALEKNILLPTGDESFGIGQFTFIDKDEFMTCKHKVYKVSAIHEEIGILREIKYQLMQTKAFNIVASAPTNLEITHSLAQKGRALLDYAKARQIQMNELMAIGDSGNDVSMLSLESAITVAMENGMEEAKKAARYITKSNVEDGVALAIQKFAL